jgi:hypothetical protein
MPPHALRKSPSSSFLSSGGAGEWSLLMTLMVPLLIAWERGDGSIA